MGTQYEVPPITTAPITTAPIMTIQNEPPIRLTYKLKEAAEVMGVSIPTIRRLISRGQIRPVRVLRHVLIRVEDLHALIAHQGRNISKKSCNGRGSSGPSCL